MGDSGTRVDAPATPDTCLFPVGGAREEDEGEEEEKKKLVVRKKCESNLKARQ
jgi:hypothetical protein